VSDSLFFCKRLKNRLPGGVISWEAMSEHRPLSPELLGQLLDEHAAALELYAAQWTHFPADVVQEAFVALIECSHPPDRTVPWLYRVVRNKSLNSLRSEQRRRRHETEAFKQRPVWWESATASDYSEGLLMALDTLSDEHREVVIARIWGELSFEDIATLTGASLSTAFRRYRDGLVKLKQVLSDTCRRNNS
jgi:RNA polymerase sigma-70 factor (ECF subfamily)